MKLKKLVANTVVGFTDEDKFVSNDTTELSCDSSFAYITKKGLPTVVIPLSNIRWMEMLNETTTKANEEKTDPQRLSRKSK